MLSRKSNHRFRDFFRWFVRPFRATAGKQADFVPLILDRLEERRVLSVTAVLADGILSVVGQDGVDESVELSLLNPGADGQSLDEFITLLDGNGQVIPIRLADGGLFVHQIPTHSLFDSSGLVPGRLDIQLGSGHDRLTLQIPNGSLFSQSGENSLLINVDGGDDTVILVDNGLSPLARDVDVRIHAQTIEFGDHDFQLGAVDLHLDGTIKLSGDQSITTDGDFHLSGEISADSWDAPNLTIDAGDSLLFLHGAIGTQSAPLGHLNLHASNIVLGENVTTLGHQVYDGVVSLSDDLRLESLGVGDIELEAIAGHGFNLNIHTGGDASFHDSIDGLDSLTISNANDVEFHGTVNLQGDLIQMSGSGQTLFQSQTENSLGGLLHLNTDSIIFAEGNLTVTGGVLIEAQGSVSVGEGVILDGVQTTLTFLVNQSETDGHHFHQGDLSRIVTTNETSDAIRIDVAGPGNAVISDLQAGATGGRVTISAGGTIEDGSATRESANVAAYSAVLKSSGFAGATSGIGVAENLNLQVSELEFDSPNGIVQISNDGALGLGGLTQSSLSFLGGGSLTTHSPLSIDVPIIVGGDFTFLASNSSSPGDTITINADVTHIDGNGILRFVAGDDILQTAGTITNRGGAVNEVQFVSDAEGNLDVDRGSTVQTGGRILADRVSFESYEWSHFTQSGNDIDVVAARVVAPGWDFNFRDVDDLRIGTVNSIVGVFVGGGDVGMLATDVTIGEFGGEGISAIGGIFHMTGRDLIELPGSIIQTGTLSVGVTRTIRLAEANEVDVLTAHSRTELVFRDVDDFAIGTGFGQSGVVSQSDLSLTTDGRITIGTGDAQPLTASGRTIRIFAGDGMIEQSGSVITASSLKLEGDGAFILDQRNDVDVLAVQSDGDVLFQDVDDLTIGIIDSVMGVMAGGDVELLAGNDLLIPGSLAISSNGTRVLLVGGDALNSASTRTGSVIMQDGTSVTAPNARIDVVGRGDLGVASISTQMDVRLTSLTGRVFDGGESGGFDVQADRLGIQAATGIGSGNPLETFVNAIAAVNTISGDVTIVNSGSSLLTIGAFDDPVFDADFGEIVGIQLMGSQLGEISINNTGGIAVEQGVLNLTGGSITLIAEDASSTNDNLTIQGQIWAIGSGGEIRLEAGNNLRIFDSGEMIDVGGATVTGLAGGNIAFGSSVIVQSSTGSIVQPIPQLSNIFTPQVTAEGLAKITGGFGRAHENNFTFQILWDPRGPVQDEYASGDPVFSHETQTVIGPAPSAGPGHFEFDHIYLSNPDPNNPAAPIPITITLYDDPQIQFVAAGRDVGQVSVTSIAPVIGEGRAGGIVFDLSIQVPEPVVPRPPVALPIESDAEVIDDDNDEQGLIAFVDVESVRNERILLIQKVDEEGELEIDRYGRPIQRTLYGQDAEKVLEDLPGLFERLRDGRWKILLKEGEDAQLQLVEDVTLRDGRPAAGDDTGTLDRPPTGENVAPQQPDSEADTGDPTTSELPQGSARSVDSLMYVEDVSSEAIHDALIRNGTSQMAVLAGP